MHVVGKGSLSSLLKVLLDVVYYLAIAGALILAVASILLGTIDVGTTDEDFPIFFEIDPSAYSLRSSTGEEITAEIVQASGNLKVSYAGENRVLWRLLLVFPVLGAVILVLHKLRQLFRRLSEGELFAPENARNLRFIGFAVIAAELVLATAGYWIAELLAREFTTSGIVLRSEFAVRMPVILTGLVVLVVAEVFRQGAVMKSDLDAAGEIQLSLLPDPGFETSEVSIYSKMQPARTVGGDYYDVVELDGGRLAFVVADVAGKGIPAALLMTLLQGSLRSLLSSGLRGADLVTRLNAYLVANTPENRLITFFYGELDPASGELRYVNAGHNPPLLFDGSQVARLDPTGVVLGVLEGALFSEERVQLEDGARLLLYTDGVTEAANPADEEFGEQRLEQLLRERAGTTPPRLIETIFETVIAFCGRAKPADDMTMMVVSRSAAGS